VKVYPFEFTLEAPEPIVFERYRAGNLVRGALGRALDARIFSPRSANGPSGFYDRPRPFVLRTQPLEGRRFERGEPFTVRVNSFIPAFADFREAFGRMRWSLVEARQLPELSFTFEARVARRVTVRFITPTELKDAGEVLHEPHFGVLLKRARDRVSALCALCQDGAPEADYAGLGLRAGAVVMAASRVEVIEAVRHSSRTGQTHSLGGFTGEADYEGELGEFVPWLEAASTTGVGRLTVWGNGWIEVGIKAG
jgi:hypothetical protein